MMGIVEKNKQKEGKEHWEFTVSYRILGNMKKWPSSKWLRAVKKLMEE